MNSLSLQLQIALRFLFRSIRSKPLTLFALISVLGIAFSVMLFLFIDTIVTGLSTHLRQTLIGFEAPLFIEVDHDRVTETQKYLEEFAALNPKYSIKHLLTRQFDGLVQSFAQQPTGIKVRAVGDDFFAIKKGEIEVFWLDGYDQSTFSKSSDMVLVGESIFERMRFLPGEPEQLFITHPFADIGPSGEVEPVQREFKVAGIFATGRVDFDDVFVLLSNPAMTSIASDMMLKNQFFVYPKDNKDADQISALWNAKHQRTGILMKTWFDKNKNIFKAMQLEKLMYFVILIFVLMISCFNLAGVVPIFELSKSTDSAILKSLGVSNKDTRAIYVLIGLFMGGLGMMLGLAMGLIGVHLIQTSGLSLPRAYGFTKLPLDVNEWTVIFLLIGTPLTAAIVSYFPTIRLGRQTVAEVLRG